MPLEAAGVLSGTGGGSTAGTGPAYSGNPRKRQRTLVSCTECHRRKQKVSACKFRDIKLLFSAVRWLISIFYNSCSVIGNGPVGIVRLVQQTIYASTSEKPEGILYNTVLRRFYSLR